MRLTTAGRAFRVAAPIVGRIARSPVIDKSKAIFLTSTDSPRPCDLSEYAAVITGDKIEDNTDERNAISAPLVHSVRETDHLRDGDVVAISPNGHIRTVYRPDSRHNTIFVTERCNSNCLMCSQPPKDRDDTAHFMTVNRAVIAFMNPDMTAVGITGGEPTLLGDDLNTLLELLRDHLPRTHAHLLTNGRLFAWPEFTERFAQVKHPDLTLGIPLYCDAAPTHDYVVQAKGAFDQTVIGLHRLARSNIQIEIRIVLHRLTIPRLINLVEFIYRNFPFVVHVALMGLEPTGYTLRHRDKLWVDPFDYQATLEEAVEYLSVRGMNVTIYNLQRCVLPRSLWGVARQSISDWKNIYLPECETCVERLDCAGFFQSAERLHSTHIAPRLPGA